MIKVLFVCYGNICRSPMAEFIFRELIKQQGRSADFLVASAATSDETKGRAVHSGTRKKLEELGIDCSGKRAVQLKKSDYSAYDYIIGMEKRNCRDIRGIVGGDPQSKIFSLCFFTSTPRDIADPWYTGDFDTAFADIFDGCKALFKYICDRHF